jgi:thiosulfate dehydrogenase [quinone] large subunit
MISPRSIGYALLRVTLGLVFLGWGVDKFVYGFLQMAQGIQAEFAKTWLPAGGAYAFAVVLPFLEVTAGALLVAGLYTTFAGALAALLMIMLTTGKVIEGNSETVALNLVYAVAIFLLLHHLADNELSLDAWRNKKTA